MTLTRSVCHAWGNATLMLRSAGLTALIASFSLASLHSRIAFFSESDSTPSALPFSSCQGLVRKKQRGRGYERQVISKLTSVQCCVLRNHHRESIRPSSSLNTISLPPRKTAIRGQDTSTCLLWMSPWPHISACPRLSDWRQGRVIRPSRAEPHLHLLDVPTWRLDKRIRHCTLWLCSRSSSPRCSPLRKPVWMQLHSGTWEAWHTWLYAPPKPLPKPLGIRCPAWWF